MIVPLFAVGCNSKNDLVDDGTYYMSGDYEIGAEPYIKISLENKSFELGQNATSSLVVSGSLKVNDNTLIAMADDGKYFFEIKDKDTLLLTSSVGNPGILFPDNSEFNFKPDFTWDENKSSFAGYTIENKKVYFNYEVCFANRAKEDTIISVGATFKAKELKGWVKEKELSNSFFAKEENGNLSRYSIPANSEKKVTLKFVGEYLGGTVNENLSFPEELIIEVVSQDSIGENEVVH